MAKGRLPGTIILRGEGTYRLQVSAGLGLDGKYKRFTKTVHCESMKAAEKELIVFYADVQANRIDKPDITTFETFAKMWLKEHVLANLKHKTYDGYKSIVDTHLIPIFGKFKLNKIKPLHIRNWINALQSRGLSQKTVVNIYGVLHSIFKSAKEWEFLCSSPAENVRPKAAAVKETDFLSYDEIIDFIAALNKLPIKNISHKAALMLVLFTGMRLGELTGLKWENVYDTHIKINQTRYYSPGFGEYTDTPKSKKGIREIDIPVECSNLLKRLKTIQSQNKLKAGSLWDDRRYVLADSLGKPIGYNTIPHWLSDFQEKYGLRKVSLHKLRHTYISMLAYLGTTTTEISKLSGHAQESTTDNIYKHLLKNRNREIANSLSKEFLK